MAEGEVMLSFADAEIHLVAQREDAGRRMATKLGVVVAANSGALVEEGAVILEARVVEGVETSLSEGDEDVERVTQRESLSTLCAMIIVSKYFLEYTSLQRMEGMEASLSEGDEDVELAAQRKSLRPSFATIII
jgi:hypothetical protein